MNFYFQSKHRFKLIGQLFLLLLVGATACTSYAEEIYDVVCEEKGFTVPKSWGKLCTGKPKLVKKKAKKRTGKKKTTKKAKGSK